MKTGYRAALSACAFALGVCLAGSPGAAQEKKEQKKGGFKAKSWDEVTDAAVAYLKTSQADDGSWSKATHPSITAVVLTGLFQSGKSTATDGMGAKGLKYLETLVDAKEGHLAAGENIRHKFYATSVAMQALKASGDAKYDKTLAAAATYMKKGQVGADDGKKQDDVNYGGFGYGPNSRGDLSNTHFALDALVAAGTPKDDPVFKRTVVFVSRMQNFKNEAQDQPWAAKTDDGSFIYVGTQPGATTAADAPKPGYGSMTYAGIKSFILCGVGKDDPRVKKGLEWVAKNYSVDINPGRTEGAGGQGYYYYLVSMARCFDALGVDEITDANGKKHDWRADINRALANRQRKDGSWGNDFGTWMEGDPNLDTAYALIALSYTKPKK